MVLRMTAQNDGLDEADTTGREGGREGWTERREGGREGGKVLT